ncbi:hypothetical protein MSUIS_05900 [Mycoplasma suis KI3806]|uniref:Uncharacterized protein n=1 Tax=Mycoplasma suis (strain KI_3806) TaxID=708248 RepID=F0V202_MYCS3|nr:hypothetical protein [Mycoplasma suis]CBZ40683.1 hypothetical protein MSUIS_05900 [Mycoplasma suis KI3806]
MGYLTWGSIFLGATVGISGTGYFASTFFNRDSNNSKTEQEENTSEDQINKKPKVWEYVLKYGDGQATCDFLEVEQSQSDREIRKGEVLEKPIICHSEWAKQILEESGEKKGLWIKGLREKVEELLKKEDSQINDLSSIGNKGEWQNTPKTLDQLKSFGCQFSNVENEQTITINCPVN